MALQALCSGQTRIAEFQAILLACRGARVANLRMRLRLSYRPLYDSLVGSSAGRYTMAERRRAQEADYRHCVL